MGIVATQNEPAIRVFELNELNPADFRPIKNYERLYAVNSQGVVISFPKKGHKDFIKVLKPRKHTGGYLRVNLSKNGIKTDNYIHRLVAAAFIDNPRGLPQINHKNGNKQDNRVENLEWCDNQHNQQHAYRIGLKTSQSCVNASLVQGRLKRKLTFEQAQRIRQLYHSKQKSFSELCKLFGVGDCVIYGIIKNLTYKVA